jgi:alpha-1,6-mannosyltransferase
MKVVDLAEFYSATGGGVRTYVEQKLRLAAAQGVEMTVVAPAAEDRLEGRGQGRIIWIASPKMPLDSNYHRFAFGAEAKIHALFDHLKPDVIEASSTWQGAWIAARWRGPAARALFLHQDPVAAYPHALLDRTLSPAAIDRAFGWWWKYLDGLERRFDTSVVSGPWLAEKLVRQGLRRPAVVPLGVDKGLFLSARPSPVTRARMLAACGIDPARDDAVLAVSVSRHHPEKRLDILMQAVQRMNAERPFGLFIIGDGPARRRVEKRAARTPGVHIAGLIPDRAVLAEMLASSDLFLHGGAAETFGLALAEGLCAGLPMVAPDAGGAADLVRPAWGEIYRAGDAAACAEAIRRLLARERRVLSEASRGAAKTRIDTPEQHFATLFNHYAGVYAAKQGGMGGQKAAVALG